MLKFIKPCSPTLVDEPPAGEGWIHEIKFDGYRTQLIIEDGTARAYTRTGIDWSADYAPITWAATETLRCSSAIIDGEVYLPDDRGAPDFHNLRSAIKRWPERLVFVGFDLLHLDGEDLRPRPVEERRSRLEALMSSGLYASNLQFSQAIEADGPEAFAAVERMGLEGIVSKRKGSRYRSGDSTDWLKTKTFVTETLDLIGIDRTDKRGIPKALFARDGKYAGGAIVALPAEERDVFWRFVEGHAQPAPSVAVPGKRSATWLPAGLKARVKHLRGEEMLRHATFIEIELEPAR